MKTLTKPDLKKIREEMQKSLDALNIGYKFTVGSCSFGDTSATFKVEVGIGGQLSSREADSFRTMADHYGFKPEDLGAKITLNKGEYTIIGLRTRSRMPVLLKNTEGKQYYWTIVPVLRALGREVPSYLP